MNREPILAHRAPDPVPAEDPNPQPFDSPHHPPVPSPHERDPVPDHNPEIACQSKVQE